MVCDKVCVKLLYVKVGCVTGGRRREEEATRDTESKTRTPHKVVENKNPTQRCGEQIYTHTETFPFVFVPFPFHFCSHSFHAFLFSCQFPFTSFHVPSISVNHIYLLTFILLKFPSFPFVLSCRSDVPLISLSVRLIFFLIFLSCFFILHSCHFSFLPFFLSSHSIFLVCPSIFESYRISAHARFKLCPWSLVVLMIFHARLCIGVPIHFVIMCSSFKAV